MLNHNNYSWFLPKELVEIFEIGIFKMNNLNVNLLPGRFPGTILYS